MLNKSPEESQQSIIKSAFKDNTRMNNELREKMNLSQDNPTEKVFLFFIFLGNIINFFKKSIDHIQSFVKQAGLWEEIFEQKGKIMLNKFVSSEYIGLEQILSHTFVINGNKSNIILHIFVYGVSSIQQMLQNVFQSSPLTQLDDISKDR